MIDVLEFILTLASLAAFLPAFFFAVETAAALSPGRRFHPPDKLAGPVAVIVPAHNESALVAATLADIKAQIRPGDRIIVVADNCTDDTAEIARDVGAEVLIRDDPDRRGKGYALQFALDSLRAAPPAIVAFLDADCRLEPDAFQKITDTAASAGQPVQALYLMIAPPGAPARLAVAAFAWIVMNRVRMRGLYKLADVTRFTGSGMAAPWWIMERLDLASGEIVEDLALSFALARSGAPALLREDAVVTSLFPLVETAAIKQRARWEHGSLEMMWTRGPALLVEGVFRADLRLIALALDLFIPPLTVLAALIAGTIVLTAFGLLAGVVFPFALSLVSAVLFGAALAAAWAGFGRQVLPPAAFVGVGRFIADKIGVYGRSGRRSAQNWTRTERPGEENGGEGAD